MLKPHKIHTTSSALSFSLYRQYSSSSCHLRTTFCHLRTTLFHSRSFPCRFREGGNPSWNRESLWIPASVGMTERGAEVTTMRPVSRSALSAGNEQIPSRVSKLFKPGAELLCFSLACCFLNILLHFCLKMTIMRKNLLSQFLRLF